MGIFSDRLETERKDDTLADGIESNYLDLFNEMFIMQSAQSFNYQNLLIMVYYKFITNALIKLG